jgi:4-amino-4-deoxy-L-arabinose transferase-like glycosyltransferase
VLALFAFARRAFGPRVALVAAALLAFHAGAVETSGDVQSEGLYVALFLAAVAALWRALDEGRLDSALAAGVRSASPT